MAAQRRIVSETVFALTQFGKYRGGIGARHAESASA
jgi:hypothetical protein